MPDLFHRRGDEGGETLPFWLPNDAQTATIITRRLHRGIVRERSADFLERVIERKVVCDDSGERRSLACWRRRLAFANFQNIPMLLHVNGSPANLSKKSRSRFLPMKHLAGIQGEREIEIRGVNRVQSTEFQSTFWL